MFGLSDLDLFFSFDDSPMTKEKMVVVVGRETCHLSSPQGVSHVGATSDTSTRKNNRLAVTQAIDQ